MLFYYWDNELRAVRKGRYKAHFITSGAYDDGERAPSTSRRCSSTSPRIPASTYDVAAAHPDVVADLVKEVEAHRKTIKPTKPLFDELMK